MALLLVQLVLQTVSASRARALVNATQGIRNLALAILSLAPFAPKIPCRWPQAARLDTAY
jgi:hypothetical protein